MKTIRPLRKYIPMAVKRAVAERQGGICLCGCGTPIWTGKKCNVEWDHSPALRLRDINEDGTDYIPAQIDPDYLVARCPISHDKKTHGTGATTAGTDAGKIKKERKRERERNGIDKPVRKWKSRKFSKGRGFPPKGSRSMREHIQ